MHNLRLPIEPEDRSALRLGALARLTGRSSRQGVDTSPSAALGVLHELALSPSTAEGALAMLHELQVYQVELDLQDEELRSARAELEADLARQRQLYDHAPVGFFTVDGGARLRELNLTGARMLGLERDDLLGQALDGFLLSSSADAFHTLLARIAEGHAGEGCALQLIAHGKPPRTVQATASADPAGPRFLVAFSDVGDPAATVSR